MSQVRFHPHKRSFMLTGSEDGLMCFFDTEVSIEEDVSMIMAFVFYFLVRGLSLCCDDAEDVVLGRKGGMCK